MNIQNLNLKHFKRKDYILNFSQVSIDSIEDAMLKNWFIRL